MPTSGKLTVGILECKNLKKMDITGASGRTPGTQSEGTASWGKTMIFNVFKNANKKRTFLGCKVVRAYEP